MPPKSPREIRDAYIAMVAIRTRAESGDVGWDALGDFFTEDAVFIDPAWGRIEGNDAIRKFFVEGMSGLEGWTFPRGLTAVEGSQLVSLWQNRLPGTREDGSFYQATGLSILDYAGEGLFSREEDILNMTQIGELIRESGWTPGKGFSLPPRNPRR